MNCYGVLNESAFEILAIYFMMLGASLNLFMLRLRPAVNWLMDVVICYLSLSTTPLR